MVISRGDTHDLLGMNIKIIIDKKVEIIIKHQIGDTGSQFKYICYFKLTSPCAQHLWDVNDEEKLLDDVKADLFQSSATKLLYITKITRLDIKPAVTFLTARVANRNLKYWKKLRRCISYLNQTVDNFRIIEGFNLADLFRWVDESYVAHPNMRIHIVEVMPMSYGILHFQSIKQNLNAKIRLRLSL